MTHLDFHEFFKKEDRNVSLVNNTSKLASFLLNWNVLCLEIYSKESGDYGLGLLGFKGI